MSYGVVSPTTAATDAKIYLPLKGLTYSSIITSPDVTTATVRGTSPNDTLIIVMKTPLAAGSAGTVTANLQFPCGTTCSGGTASVQPYFAATNASGQASSSPTSLTARAADPNYQISILNTAYNGTTRRGTYTVRLTASAITNYLALASPTLSFTVPAGVNLITPGNTNNAGTRTNFPTTIAGGNFTPVSTTAAGPNATKVISWTSTTATSFLPTYFRGGTYDITNIVLEYPTATFPVNSTAVLNAAFSGVLSSTASPCGSSSGSRSFTQTVTDFTPSPAATGCTSQTLLTGLYSGATGNANAIFTGKVDQSRITLPIVNTGNVTLTNLIYTIEIPTNELAATYVGLSGSAGPTGTVYYRTNQNTTYRQLGPTALAIGGTRSFTLNTGEYVTHVQVTSTSLASGSNMSAYVNTSQLSPLRSGTAVNASPLSTFAQASTAMKNSCYGGFTCATTSVTVTAEYSGSAVMNQTCSGSRVIVQPTASIQNLNKAIPSPPSSYVPGTVYQYRLQFAPITTGDTLRNLVLTDALPATLEYVGNLKYSSNTTTASNNFTSGTALPVFSRSGQTLTWSWAALPSLGNKIVSPQDHYIYFDVRVKNGATGNITNCFSATATSAYFSTTSACAGAVTVSSLAKIDAVKWVRGDLDRNYVRYPRVAHTTDGGRADYRFVIINSGNVAYKNIVLTDIFPWIGDKTVSADYDRLSEWRAQLLQSLQFYTKAAADSARPASTTIATPANVTVSYSTQTNPCRSEFSPPYSPSGCVENSWSTTPPANLSTVQAIKINIAGPFAAGDTLVFGVAMRSPPGTELQKVAWNSFAYQVTRNDNNSTLPVAEPNKVGIDVKRFPAIGNYVWNDVNGNGQQDEPASQGANGVSVQLWSPGGDGVSGTADDFLAGTRVTANGTDGSPGYYKFDSLFADTYYLRFIAPAGRAFTRQSAAGVSDDLNSDAGGQTGWTGLINLGPDEQKMNWDAGLCVIPDAGPDKILCAPATSVDLPDATGSQSWTAVDTNPPGAAINATSGLVTGLTTGVFRYVLTSGGGCVDTVVVERKIPAIIALSNPMPCAGESVTLTAQTSGTAATYQWAGPGSYSASGRVVVLPGVTTARSGSYTLTVTDSGCTSTTTATLTVNAPPQVTVQVGACVSSTNQYSISGNITVTNPSGATVIVTDTDGVRSASVVVVTTQATTAYSLTGLLSTGMSHTLTATYSPTYCTPTTVTYVAPVSCSCVVSATVAAGSCQNNGTFNKTTDDYFRPIVTATNTVPGGSNRYVVVLNANADGSGGTILNSGGTAYGQAVTVGSAGQFPADDLTMYQLTIRDINTSSCFTTRLSPTVPPCSTCLPVPCLPVRALKIKR